MAYWIYENKIVKSCRIHEGSCGFCNDGRGRRSAAIGDSSKWHGPFNSIESAKLFGSYLPVKPLPHACCDASALASVAGGPAASGYKRFEIPNVDESTLTLEELFHRRMLQIYTSMRDDLGYSPKRFLTSVRRHGGVEHAKRSLRRSVAMQTGLQKLKDEGKRWTSMEAHVIAPEFAALFNQWEIEEAKRRLNS